MIGVIIWLIMMFCLSYVSFGFFIGFNLTILYIIKQWFFTFFLFRYKTEISVPSFLIFLSTKSFVHSFILQHLSNSFLLKFYVFLWFLGVISRKSRSFPSVQSYKLYDTDVITDVILQGKSNICMRMSQMESHPLSKF